MRETPPSALMSAGTRSNAMTATAPASSAIRAYMSQRLCAIEWEIIVYLFSVDHIHDDSSFQHAGESSLHGEAGLLCTILGRAIGSR